MRIWADLGDLGQPVRKALCRVRKNTNPARVGPVAQWLEPAAHNRLVGGSSPSGPTITIVFIIEKVPRPKTLWAHYGPNKKGGQKPPFNSVLFNRSFDDA